MALFSFTLACSSGRLFAQASHPHEDTDNGRRPGASARSRSGDVIPAGTTIVVRTNERIDVKSADSVATYTGIVERDIVAADGHVAIPRGSNADLVVRRLTGDELAIDLDSVSAAGRRFRVSAQETLERGTRKQGLGVNQRTGKYVGGGALIGTVLGAIAGGGRGATIGAASGAAAGAGAQVLTRGRTVRIPAESVLTFQLEKGLSVEGTH